MMTGKTRKRLVLWDIDRTLIESRGVGRMVYERVFPEVVGKPLREMPLVHGRTELDIMYEALRSHDVEPTEHLFRRLSAALAEGFRAVADELAERGRVLPGVRNALAGLAAEPTMHQGVLTGNTAEVARIKLEAFGLDRHLDLSTSAFGDDHRERPELVTIARERAARRFRTPIPVEHVVLIGDTPADVHAALSTGARVIAVATGVYSVDELLAAGASSVLETLTPSRFRRALESVFSE
ncbi:haloacid dehalogenase [Saccharomonospora viridis]|nr:haloacid dehalogenase [Saccharomonospora viridis]